MASVPDAASACVASHPDSAHPATSDTGINALNARLRK